MRVQLNRCHVFVVGALEPERLSAGSARIALRATSSAGSRDISLETVANKDTDTIDHFVVQLVGVTPAPLTSDPIPAAAYRATLRVVRKN